MKRTLYISFLLVLYLMFSSRSCDNRADSEQRRVKHVRDSIASVSGTETPEQEQIRASETTALQKLQDFTEYVNILADTSYEKAFRTKTATLASSLFVKGSSISLPGITGDEKLRMEDFVEKCLENEFSTGISFISARSEAPAVKLNDSLYSGVIRMEYTLGRKPFLAKTEFHLALVNKKFGTENLRTWKVLLGDIAP